MARKTVDEATTKWQQRTAQSQQYYTSGVQGATNWAENSQAAAPARNAGLQAAIADGRIDRGIARVGTAGWKQKTLAKGPANWAAGVAAGGPAYRAGLQKVYGYFSAADQAVSNMPRGTFAENMARMNTFVQTVHDQAQAAKSQ